MATLKRSNPELIPNPNHDPHTDPRPKPYPNPNPMLYPYSDPRIAAIHAYGDHEFLSRAAMPSPWCPCCLCNPAPELRRNPILSCVPELMCSEEPGRLRVPSTLVKSDDIPN